MLYNISYDAALLMCGEREIDIKMDQVLRLRQTDFINVKYNEYIFSSFIIIIAF